MPRVRLPRDSSEIQCRRRRLFSYNAGEGAIVPIQPLELRRLLSATLDDNGLLSIGGTTSDDIIDVRLNSAGDHLIATVNGVESSFTAKLVTQLTIGAGAGNDSI